MAITTTSGLRPTAGAYSTATMAVSVFRTTTVRRGNGATTFPSDRSIASASTGANRTPCARGYKTTVRGADRRTTTATPASSRGIGRSSAPATAPGPNPIRSIRTSFGPPRAAMTTAETCCGTIGVRVSPSTSHRIRRIKTSSHRRNFGTVSIGNRRWCSLPPMDTSHTTAATSSSVRATAACIGKRSRPISRATSKRGKGFPERRCDSM